MSKGIARKIDELGRIVIPIEIRRTADVMNREKLMMSFIDGVMHLTKANGSISHSRGLDKQGRYTIPMEIRRSHGWEIGQVMDIYVEGGDICINKEGCFICGSTEGLEEIDGFHICRKHVLEIAERAYES